MANNFVFMADFLKELGEALDEMNTAAGDVKEVGISYDTDREYIVVETVFFVPIQDNTDCLIGKCVINVEYLDKLSDQELVQQCVGEIILDIEQQILNNSDMGITEVTIH
jgi:hypothetical protein